MSQACPCGSALPYWECCERFHSHTSSPRTAEQLMRARYSAFALSDGHYLLETWHPDTVPRKIVLDESIEWTGLEVRNVSGGSAFENVGTVEFVAHFIHHKRRRDVPGKLHETSRFVSEDMVWSYYDGQVH